MRFDKNKVYTSLNADDIKVGSLVFFGDNMLNLRTNVQEGIVSSSYILDKVLDEKYPDRFVIGDGNHSQRICNLVYLVKEPKEDKYRPYKNGDEAFTYLHDKWLVYKDGNAKRMITDFVKDSVYFCNDKISFTILFNNFEIYNEIGKNEPCGVKIKEE